MESQSLFQHYLSPIGLIVILVAISSLYLLCAGIRRNYSPAPRNLIPGHVRLGVGGKSNIYDVSDRKAPTNLDDKADSKLPEVKALFVYPVKSCQGIELSNSVVTSLGLQYDRIFSFAQLESRRTGESTTHDSKTGQEPKVSQHWRFVTQRELPKLALLETELWIPKHCSTNSIDASNLCRSGVSGNTGPNLKAAEYDQAAGMVPGETQQPAASASQGGWLIVRFPFQRPSALFGLRTETVTLQIPLVPTPERAKVKGYTYDEMEIWKDRPQAINISSEIDVGAMEKLKSFLGAKNPIGLFRVDDTKLRDITRSLPKDRPNDSFNVGFADAFPVHLLSLASINALAEQIPDSSPIKANLDVRRFRANIYVSNASAFAEDEWKRIAMGKATDTDETSCSAVYHVACRTARCKLPNVDPDSGVRDRNEPQTTLIRTRQVDEGAKPHPCLGVSMIPLFRHGTISVGDKVEIQQTGVHVYEKMFQ